MRRLSYALRRIVLILLILGFTSFMDEVKPIVGAIYGQILIQSIDIRFDLNGIQIGDHHNPLTRGSSKQYIFKEDIGIPKSQMREMLDSNLIGLGANGKQYRSGSLVCSSRYSIRIIEFASSLNVLDKIKGTALQWTANNYNKLIEVGVGLDLSLAFRTSYSPQDIAVYKASGGRSASLPYRGKPCKFIQIQSGTGSFNSNVVEHMITYEIERYVGLRDTDYFGKSISSGIGGVGIAHIHSTLANANLSSMVLAPMI